MTTESLMVHALQRGLLLQDFNALSVGMILDYIYRYDQLRSNIENREKKTRQAEQGDFNIF